MTHMQSDSRRAQIFVLHADLAQAIERLKEALSLPPTRIHKDATIQRFEFCFELAWKLLHAVIRYKSIDAYGPRDSIRVAARLSLITDPEEWMNLLDARNVTVHVYKELVADKTYEKVHLLVPLVEHLLVIIKKDSSIS